MTKVICFLNDGNVYCDISGHSDYKNPDTDNNDVCVAVSTLVCMLVRYMKSIGIDPDICEDGHVLFNRMSQSKTTRAVFEAALIELEALEQEYPEHIKIY